MADLGLNEAWGQELGPDLSTEAVVLQSGATRIVAEGHTIHVPRLLVAPEADWTEELEELPSDAGDGDVLDLTPKKLGNVIALSRESIGDAPINELDAVGRSMVRGVAQKVDAKFFSDDAAASDSPAGLLDYTLPTGGGTPDIETLTRAVGEIAAAGGKADTIYISPGDLTELRVEALQGGFTMSDPRDPGLETIAGARLFPAPVEDGTAIVCQARYIALAVRRDASVDFSEDALFSKDAVAARVTMRVDWAPSDPNAFYVIGGS